LADRGGLSWSLGEAFRARWYIGLRAGLSVGVPLLAGIAAGRPSWAALASIGGFAGFYGPDTPYRHRVRLVAGVGAALAVVVPVGSLCAPRALLSVAFAGMVAAVSSFVCLALRVPPPREYLIVLAALAATAIPAGLMAALRECALVAGGATVAGLITMAPALGRWRVMPQLRALSRAWAAVADVLSAAGTPGAASARARAVADLSYAREVLRQARTGTDDMHLRSLAAAEIVLASGLSVSIDARTPLDPGWVTATRRLGTLPADTAPVPGTPADDAGLRGLRQALKAARRILLGDSRSARDVTELDRQGTAERLRDALSPRAVVVPAAARIGIVVAVGAGLGRALGLDHAYWVGLTAAAVLQASNVTLLLRRSLRRLGGTIAGVALAGAVFALHPAVIAVTIVVILAQFTAEVVMRASYALAVTFVTVIALCLYDLAVPVAATGAAIGARVLDTAIGAALAIALRLVLWPRAAGARLPRVQAQALRTVASVFRSRWLSDQAGLERAQRQLQEQLLNLRTITEDILADQVIGSSVTRLDQVTLAIDELAMLALGLPFGRERPARPAAETLVRRLEQLAGAVENQLPPPDPHRSIELPGYPRTQAATELLASAIG
jgi:uncharacterized membrane protein YccC